MPSTNGAGSTPTQLRVIGVGLGRTGTRSMKEALEILGFGPCHHMVSIIEDPTNTRRDIFVDAFAGKPINWKQAMAGFGSTVDHPTTDFALELIKTFPDALAVLTTRDNAEVWWESMTATIYSSMCWQTRMLTWSVPGTWRFHKLAKGISKWYRSNYGPLGPQSYIKHNARMMESIPKEKLLVFNVKQGWEPLCTFLGVPVTKVPFPRMNDTAELRARFRIMHLTGLGFWALELSLLGLILHQTIKRRVCERAYDALSLPIVH